MATYSVQSPHLAYYIPAIPLIPHVETQNPVISIGLPDFVHELCQMAMRQTFESAVAGGLDTCDAASPGQGRRRRKGSSFHRCETASRSSRIHVSKFCANHPTLCLAKFGEQGYGRATLHATFHIAQALPSAD